MNISPAQPRLPRLVVPACIRLRLPGPPRSAATNSLPKKVAAAEAAAQRAESVAPGPRMPPAGLPLRLCRLQTASVQSDDEPGVEDTVVEHDPNEPSNPPWPTIRSSRLADRAAGLAPRGGRYAGAPCTSRNFPC